MLSVDKLHKCLSRLSMKLFDMFDQNPPHTLDKVMPIKNDLKVDLQPKRSRS